MEVLSSNTVAAINNLNYIKAILRLSADKGRAGIFGAGLWGGFVRDLIFKKPLIKSGNNTGLGFGLQREQYHQNSRFVSLQRDGSDARLRNRRKFAAGIYKGSGIEVF